VLVVAVAIGTVPTGGLGNPATNFGLAALLGARYGTHWSIPERRSSSA
jgi:hypothetical protein